jgi:hypothetical protein
VALVKLSPNAVELAGIVKRLRAAHVARVVGSDESAVRSWVAGKRVPKAAWREKLRDAFGLSVDGWTVAAVAVAGADTAKGGRSRRETPAPPTSENTVPAGNDITGPPPEIRGEQRLEQVIAECDELLRVANEPGSHASVRDRATILSTKSSAAIRLSKVRGEDAVSMRKILESREWQTIMRDCSVFFASVAPVQLRAFIEKMDELDRAYERRGRE